MDIFTLHSEDNIKEEEAKVENLKKLISTINSKNITTRH
jgi:pyruvate carboxylase subunit A